MKMPMSEKTYYLVEANLAYARAALDHPLMADFVSRLDEIDALAQGWPGFIAQPKLPDEGQIYSEPALLNVSIWRSVEDVQSFTYASEHTQLLDRRAEWFVQGDRPAYVLYWAPEGQGPTEAEIQRRFAHLQEHGPTPYAFNFQRPFRVAEMLAFTNEGLHQR
jgi:hypothetical protein